MKFIVALILNMFLSYAIGLFTFLPWFSFVIIVFVVSVLVHQKPFLSFITGFVALFVLWLVLVVIKDQANEHILSTKVAYILPLKGSYFALAIITAFIGGLLGGFAALTASFARKILK
jgi:hypothetical protein